MPFDLVNDDDPSVTIDDATKCITVALNEQVKAIVQEAVDAALHIKNPSGVKVCRLTGRIVD